MSSKNLYNRSIAKEAIFLKNNYKNNKNEKNLLRGSFNKSLENPRDGARNIKNGFVLINIITH